MTPRGEQTFSRRRAAAAVPFVLACAACTVGPTFRPPAPPAVARYTSPDESSGQVPLRGAPSQTVALGDASPPSKWWTLFHSPALDTVLDQAIAGSLTIESAKSRLAEAGDVLAENASGLYPQASFGASATRGKFSATSFGLSPSAFELPPNYDVFQLGPSASYDLDLFGGQRRSVEQQKALAAASGFQLDAAYLDLTDDAAKGAIQLAVLRAELKATDDILAIDRQDVELVGKERDAGSVPDSDVVLVESQLAADETLEPDLMQQLSVARHALAVLLGRAPADWSPPDLDLAALTLPDRLPVEIPSALVHRRPDILAAEAELHAATAAVGVATAALYPDVTLSAAVSAAALDPGHLFNPSSLVWSIAAGVTQPLFDGGLRRARRRAAIAALRTAAIAYRQTVLDSFRDVADLLEALDHDARLAADEQQALQTASDSVQLQRLSFAEGGAGILGLLDAQRAYQQALLGWVRADGARFRDTVDLLVATGGGWQARNKTASDLRNFVSHRRTALIGTTSRTA